MPAPKTATAAADVPFKFVGGDPSVDLVNTVDWTAGGLVHERLTSYERLTRWAEGASVVPPEAAARLRRMAKERPAAGDAACEQARRLRFTLQRLYGSIAAGRTSPVAWSELTAELAAALARLRLSPADPRRSAPSVATWEWRDRGQSLESLLWPVVWAAADLVTSEEASRLRVCGGPDCGWMYV